MISGLIAVTKLVPGWVWALLLVAALLVALAIYERKVGEQIGADRVQAKWDAERRAQQEAAAIAINQRIEENKAMVEKHRLFVKNIRKEHEDEIDRINAAAAATAGELLYIRAACAAPVTGEAIANGTGGGAAAPAGTVALPAEITRNLRALMVEADTVAAGCRAAQKFIKDNGMGG